MLGFICFCRQFQQKDLPIYIGPSILNVSGKVFKDAKMQLVAQIFRGEKDFFF